MYIFLKPVYSNFIFIFVSTPHIRFSVHSNRERENERERDKEREREGEKFCNKTFINQIKYITDNIKF